MSSPPSNLSPPPSGSIDSWKRKYDILEAQCAISKDFGPKSTAYVPTHFSGVLSNHCEPSVTANQKSLGRHFRRIVDMFTSVRDLIEENDRRMEASADGDESEELDEE